MLGLGGKVDVAIKQNATKCNVNRLRELIRIPLNRQKIAADENIRSEWTDKENVP